MGGFSGGQNFVKSLGQDVNRRGLEQNAADTDRCGLLLVFGTYVPGGQDDRRGWADRENLARNFEAGDARHGEVGDNRGESLGIGAKFGEGSQGVSMTSNVVAQPFQKVSAESDEGFLVVDEEQVFGMDGFESLLDNERRGCGIEGGIGSGKIEKKGRAFARLAVNGNRAIVTTNNAMNDGEAETGALADGFCREEGIENAVQGGAIHAAAVVGDGETHIRSTVQTRRALAIFGSDDAARQSNGDMTRTIADGMRSVGGQIDDDLMELTGIDEHERKSG